MQTYKNALWSDHISMHFRIALQANIPHLQMIAILQQICTGLGRRVTNRVTLYTRRVAKHAHSRCFSKICRQSAA